MISLVLPTYNEAQNLPVLLPKVQAALKDMSYEIIIVDDDSPDGTWRVALHIAREQPHIRVLRRVGRNGLSSAVIEGWLAASGDVLAVMDADGQHDTDLLPRLTKAIEEGNDLTIGSRYTEGGSVGSWDERRYALSRLGTKLAIRLCAVPVKDPMSGFFAIRRSVFEDALRRLNPKGFKILLDLLVHVSPETRVTELPFTFGQRLHGESKLSWRIQLEFLEYLYDVLFGRFIPLTFVKYCIVGSLGVIVNILAYLILERFLTDAAQIAAAGFSLAVLGAIEVAILFNFILNNAWTFKRQRLRGLTALNGFLRYNIACALGALANYAVSIYLFSVGTIPLLSVFLGALVGAAWNYTMSRILTWKVTS